MSIMEVVEGKMVCAIAVEVRVAALLASFGDHIKSPNVTLVTAMQTASESIYWEALSAKLLNKYEEIEWTAASSSTSSRQDGKALSVRNSEFVKTRTSKGNMLHWKCYECGKPGHFAPNWFSRKKLYEHDQKRLSMPSSHNAFEAHDLLARQTRVGRVRVGEQPLHFVR